MKTWRFLREGTPRPHYTPVWRRRTKEHGTGDGHSHSSTRGVRGNRRGSKVTWDEFRPTRSPWPCKNWWRRRSICVAPPARPSTPRSSTSGSRSNPPPSTRALRCPIALGRPTPSRSLRKHKAHGGDDQIQRWHPRKMPQHATKVTIFRRLPLGLSSNPVAFLMHLQNDGQLHFAICVFQFLVRLRRSSSGF